MQMFNLSHDPERHHYAFGRHDRITIDGLTYTVNEHSRNEMGWLLQRDDQSGRCAVFSHRELSRMGSMGKIRVVANYHAPETARRRLRTGVTLLSELSGNVAARVTRRSAYVEAFLEMEREGLIKRTDACINANRHELRSRAMAYADRLVGGLGVPASEDLSRNPSARSLRRWLGEFRGAGMAGLVDAMNRRGQHGALIEPEAYALMMREVQGYASEGRPTMRNVHGNVVRALDVCNQDRRAQGLHPYPVPSYETVRRAIHRLEPFQVACGREGFEAACKKFKPNGEGLQLTRPLERVEIDENTIDIVSLTEAAGLRALLTDEERKRLGLDKSKARWSLTVTICATTRCILGMAFSRSPREEASLQVLRMILRDKGKWADATGSLGSWDMHGTPPLIVTDNGPAFKSERFRIACADLGITTMRAPAGLPQMRGRNERFFNSLNTGLLPRLPAGRSTASARKETLIRRHALR